MIVEGSRRERDLEVSAEVVVVGSGAGGAVVARELAEEGVDVLVLEEGPHVPASSYGAWRPTVNMRRLWRRAGTTMAVGDRNTPALGLLTGMCVGGSSALTGGVCLRVPEEVHADWAERLDEPSLSAEAMRDCYERVEEGIHVEEVPASMRTRSTELFDEGARRMGFALDPLRRNTRGCEGCSLCNVGCPQLAKRSVDLNYLPRARELGVRIHADHRADRLLIEGGRVRGVEGRLVQGPERKPTHRFTVRADRVVLAAGTLHTPLLMLRSRSTRRTGHVGRHLTLHPTTRVTGVFDERVDVWNGALQSAWSDHFDDRGITLVSASAPVNMLAGGIGGAGPSFMAGVRELPHVATFGALVHDEPSGRIRRMPGREPLVRYRLRPDTRRRLYESIRIMCRAYLEAGAREVIPPVFGVPPLRSVDELDRVDAERLSARRVECVSFHPLGTCRMGRDATEGVVDPWGRSFEVDGLWIADGSVLPSSVGVNTQLPIMAMATRIVRGIAESVHRHRAGGSARS